jgi:hypothetical protein
MRPCHGTTLSHLRNADDAGDAESAACDRCYVPDEVQGLANPGADEYVDEACKHFETIVAAYGGEAAVRQHALDEDRTRDELVEPESSFTIYSSRSSDDASSLSSFTQ